MGLSRTVAAKVISKYVATKKVAVLGSFARKKPFIGDIDLLVIGGRKIVFTCVHKRVSGGEKKEDYLLYPPETDGEAISVNVYFLPKDKIHSLPFMLMTLIGPKEENIRMRYLAKQKGYTLNQYGIKLPDGTYMKKRFPSIASVYKFLDATPRVKYEIYVT